MGNHQKDEVLIYNFESRNEHLLPRPLYLKRLWKGAGLTVSMLAVSLTIGILGYHLTEHMGWIDSLLNASMILGGMGPVDILHSNAAKIFASIYAIFSGMFLIAAAGILLAPVFHRILHSFHADR